MCHSVIKATWTAKAHCFPIFLSGWSVFLSTYPILTISFSFSLSLQSHCRWRLFHTMEKSASENPSSFYVKVSHKYTETNLSNRALLSIQGCVHEPYITIQSCAGLNFWATVQINKMNCAQFKSLPGRFFFFLILSRPWSLNQRLIFKQETATW